MKILITSEYDDNHMKMLEERWGEVVYKPWSNRGGALNEDALIQLMKEVGAEALITELDTVSEKVVKAFPNLKFIGDCRATPVNIDIKAAEAAGIPVLTTPGRNAEAVAELFVGSLLSFVRHIGPAVRWIDDHQWTEPAPYAYYKFQGSELMGKKVGFVGFGAVGQRIAEILVVFGCDIQYYDPYVHMAQYEKSELEVLFSTSDIVSVNLPVLPATKGLVDGRLLKRMKKEAIFVNTARAAVVDTEALYEVLKSESIRGAVLDVFDSEPPSAKDVALQDLPNVLSTPHIAGATKEVVLHQSKIINQKIEELKL